MRASAAWRSTAVEAAALASLVLALAPAVTATAATQQTPTAPDLLPAAAAPPPPSPLACDNIVTDQGRKYNLRPLAGPHVVVTHEYTRPTYHNTSYAIDVCGVLKSKGKGKAEERCPDGTRVCAIKHRWDPEADKLIGVDQVIPIVAGDEQTISWEAKWLSPDEDGEAKKDGEKEGLRLTLQGGLKYQERTQRTVVDFRCNPDLEGTEGEWESPDEYVPGEKDARAEEDKNKEEGGKDGDGKKDGDKEEKVSMPEKQLKKDGAALIWGGYKRGKDADGGEMDTLYLTWYTKHACDAAVDEPAEESKGWSFFTWFVVLFFLAIASYLIFGSWLNYNRYGARGWDLLPHGDTLRDAPYIIRDLVRRILNTLQSTGSRGGYSAV
ncbi:autophagy-related protein 27 [Thermothelomyces heterothallicus CBS 202.75]|uniref:autophagy-related protein 27 n=1 Tax=Thermothelomyces heterothallicus CBS 202.75 TaxID=1149848 RepID=UPI0037445ACA